MSVLYHTGFPFLPFHSSLFAHKDNNATETSSQKQPSEKVYLHRYPGVTSSTNYACAFSPLLNRRFVRTLLKNILQGQWLKIVGGSPTKANEFCVKLHTAAFT